MTGIATEGRLSAADKAIMDALSPHAIPHSFTKPIHSRISILEALMLSTSHTVSLNPKTNQMLRNAVNEDCFSQMLAFNLPASIFTNDTLSIVASTATGSVDLYTSLLPPPTEEQLYQKTVPRSTQTKKTASAAGGGGGGGGVVYVDPATFVPGDPKTIQMPVRRASDLLHLFFMLPYMKMHYHSELAGGDAGLDRLECALLELTAAIRKCDAPDSDEPGSNVTWVDVLKRYDKHSVIPPWCPALIEELVDAKNPTRVLTYRFVVFINKEIDDDVQNVFNEYLSDIIERVKYNSALLAKIKTVAAPQQAAAVAANAANPRAQANAQAALVAQHMADMMTPFYQEFKRTLDKCMGDKAESIRALAFTQIRSWEASIMRAVIDPRSMGINPATVLAKNVREVLSVADNVIVPPPKRRGQGGVGDSDDSDDINATMDIEGDQSASNHRRIAGRGFAEPVLKPSDLNANRTHIKSISHLFGNLSLNDSEEEGDGGGEEAEEEIEEDQRANRMEVVGAIVEDAVDDDEYIAPAHLRKSKDKRKNKGKEKELRPSQFPPPSAARQATASAPRRRPMDAAESRAQFDKTLAELTEFARSQEYLIGQPELFSQSLYLPSVDLRIFENANYPNPGNPTDPRALTNVFDLMTSFWAFVDTAGRADQSSPYQYFGALRKQAHLGGLGYRPTYDFEAPEHEIWQDLRETHPAYSFGHLINHLPSSHNVPRETLHKSFLGFPDEVVKLGLVTLVLPSLQPWHVGMLPLPNVIRHNRMLLAASKVIEPIAHRGHGNPGQFLTKLQGVPDGKFAPHLSSFYMAVQLSTGVIEVDAQKFNLKQTNLPIAYELDPETRNRALRNNAIVLPETFANLSSIYMTIHQFLMEERVMAARKNNTFTNVIGTRIAYEGDMPWVVQPDDDGSDGSGYGDQRTRAMDSTAREKFLPGMDVFTHMGNSSIKSHNIIEAMTSSTHETGRQGMYKLSLDMLRLGRNLKLEANLATHPTREQTRAILINGVEDLNRRLLDYCVKTPKMGAPMAEEPMTAFQRIGQAPRHPLPWLPMSIPMASIFTDFARRHSGQKWAHYCINEYNNTSSLEEIYSRLANTGVNEYTLHSGIDTYLIVHLAVNASALIYHSRIGPHLNVLLAGETATSKSFIIELFRKLCVPSMIIGSNTHTKGAFTAHANFDYRVDLRDEAPDEITVNPDKKKGANTEDANKLENLKMLLDTSTTEQYYLDIYDETGKKTNRRVTKLAMGLYSGSVVWATNRYLGEAQNAVLHRLLILYTPMHNDNAKAMPGSHLPDYSLRNKNAFDHNFDPSTFRVLHFYSTIVHVYCHINPRYEPDMDDAINFIGEVLRRSKSETNKGVQETRRNGRIWALLRQVCINVAVHKALTELDLVVDGKWAPCIMSEGRLTQKHITTQDFLDRVVKHLYATKDMAIMVLTLLRDVFESPIRSALLSHFASRFYPEGRIEFSKFHDVNGVAHKPSNTQRKKKKTAAAAPAAAFHVGGGEEELKPKFDYNTVTYITQHTSLDELCGELGRNASKSTMYSDNQIKYVLDGLKKERIEIHPDNDSNEGAMPRGLYYPGPESLASKTGAQSARSINEQLAQGVNEYPDVARVAASHSQSIRAAVDNTNTARQPEDGGRGVAPPMSAAEQELRERFAGERLDVVTHTTPYPLITFRKMTIAGKEVWCIHGSHEYFRKIYRPENMELGDENKEADAGGAKTTHVDTFKGSVIWKVIKEILETDTLEKYPDYIMAGVEKGRRTGEFSSKGVEYLRGGKYTYLTGRTDAISYRAKDMIAAAQRDVDNFVDEELRKGNSAIGAEMAKKQSRIPTALLNKCLIDSPVLQRSKVRGFTMLPCLVTGVRDPSSEGMEVDEDGEGDEDNYIVIELPNVIETYYFDIDYTAFVRRYMRLGWEINEDWKHLPIFTKIRKSMEGACYPQSFMQSMVNENKRFVMTATRNAMRAGRDIGGDSGSGEHGDFGNLDDAELDALLAGIEAPAQTSQQQQQQKQSKGKYRVDELHERVNSEPLAENRRKLAKTAKN